MASADRFGFEWATYPDIVEDYELQFRKWVAPLGPDNFRGKKVLDAGCGMGRNAYWACRFGASGVLAFDADLRSVAAARKNLSQFPNAHVEFSSIYDISWQSEFDIAFSIGVIHHLEDPVHGVRKLSEAVRPGGVVLIWVYGYEGNEWIVRFISPVRRFVTSRLPPRLLYYLTYLISIPFYVFLKIISVKSIYLQQLRAFRLWHVHSIIFDQLLPSIAIYYRKSEAEELLRSAGLMNVFSTHVNNNSWSVIGTKPVLQ